MKMTNQQWKNFFIACNDILGTGHPDPKISDNWCAWTIFGSIGINYWSGGIPIIDDLRDTHTRDNGVWSQPFGYEQLAHIILPREFEWHNSNWNQSEDVSKLFGFKTQDVDALSERLCELSIEHNISEHCLDIKLF